jgi:membrane-associated phospholipid phosphatase
VRLDRAACLLAVAASATSSTAHAEDLHWHDEWARFRVSEHVATGTAAVGAGVLFLAPRADPRWGEGILFDDAVRRTLRAESHAGRKRAGAIATSAYMALLVHPLLTDGLIVPLVRHSREVAAQVTLIDLEALAFTALVFEVTEAAVARARPYVWDCMKAGGDAKQCRESARFRTNSFISGHAGIAATGAALTCVTHLRVQPYGESAAPIVCGVALGLAMVAGVGRIVSDDHYLTDVIAGFVVGAAAGFVLPSLLHYGFDGHGPPGALAETRSTALSIAF